MALFVPTGGARPQSCVTSGKGLGTIAYAARGSLHVLSLETCTNRVVVRRGVRGVRWSPDGRFLAYGDGAVVAAEGGSVSHPLGRSASWQWRPGTHELVGTTPGGGLLLGRPGDRPERLLPEGWGAGNPVFDPSGKVLGLVRQRGTHSFELWLVHWPTRTAQVVAGGRRLGDPPILATVSPAGGWVFWWTGTRSNSLLADGAPLIVKGSALGALGPRIATSLLHPEFLAWCGTRLLVTAGGDRYSTHGKRLLVASPPLPGYGQLWRVRDLSRDRSRSWVSPACSPDGRSIAVSAGRNWFEPRFGTERRSIWIVGFDGSRRRLTSPGAASDELPRWSRNGRYVLFVRTRLGRGSSAARGNFRLVDVRSGRATAVAVSVSGGIGYYGHYGWAETTDWYR